MVHRQRSFVEGTGQTLVEYALLLGALVLGALLATTMTGLSGVIQAAMTAVTNAV